MSRRDSLYVSSCSKEFSTKRENFLPCPDPPRVPPHPIDNRVTASRSRRLRVLLTGRHGNLATSLQWPKVDGLRAGAPEQTEQKSVHARTRNRTCNVFVALSLSLFPCLSLSSYPLHSPFFSLLSLFGSRREFDLLALERTCRWCLCLVPRPSRLPEGTIARGRRQPLTVTLWSDSIDFVSGEAIV